MREFRYDPPRRFRGWLWTVTVNKLREWRRRRAAVVPHVGEQALAVLAAPGAEPDEEEYRQYVLKRAVER